MNDYLLLKKVKNPHHVGVNLILDIEGEPSGLALASVDFDLRVPPCCLVGMLIRRGAMPILPDCNWQLP